MIRVLVAVPVKLTLTLNVVGVLIITYLVVYLYRNY